jgi:hypothetical protein
MQLEIKTEGVDFVVSRAPQPKNDAEGRQKADRETGALLHVTELVTMDATGVEVIKVTTTGEPKLTKQQFVTVLKLVATPWTIEGHGGVAFHAESITPVTTAAPAATTAGSAVNGHFRRAVKARGHFPNENAALKFLNLTIISLDLTSRGRQCWTNR